MKNGIREIMKRCTFLSTFFVAALLLGASNCSPPNDNTNSNQNTNDNTSNDNQNGDQATYNESVTLDSLTIAPGDSSTVSNNAVLTITGDASIDGTLSAVEGRLTLIVEGDLTINGTLSATGESGSDSEDDTPLNEQTTALIIQVGEGSVTLGDSAVLDTTGPVVITDDPTTLEQTPTELFNSVEDVSDNDLPTLVPLPPDHEAFNDASAKIRVGPRQPDQAAGAPITIGGTWPPAGAAPPAGDQPIIIFRFEGDRDLNLDDWMVNGPAAPTGESANQSENPGDNASGQKGKNGLRLNIFNNGGKINITNDVVLNLADGGDGGDATSVCATATGGDGGQSGNFRMTAANGIDLTAGTLTINPGRGGHGGSAAVNSGTPGADGCDGETGQDASATGGKGGSNLKRIFARGNVQGVENLIIGDLIAGDGGDATATACDGGNGLECCSGGAGGNATATGGAGGEASLNVSGLSITSGDALGGDGGEATAEGGNGGLGGDCKFDDGGDGGTGGSATATSGAGGNASTTGGGVGVGGDTLPATAIGGDGSDGGDSGFGDPGAGGAKGSATATNGAVGTGSTTGTALGTETIEGSDGQPGGQMSVTLYCLGFAFVIPGTAGETIPPGTQEAPVFGDDNITQIGTMSVEFVDVPGAVYMRGADPDHIGLDASASIDFEVSTLTLDDGTPGVIGGLRIAVLFANGVDANNPLIVQALDENGQVIGTQEFTEVPSSFNDPENPQFIDALFDVDVSVATFRLTVPAVSFVTPFQVYLLDP